MSPGGGGAGRNGMGGGWSSPHRGLQIKEEVSWGGLRDSRADFVCREGIPGGEQNVGGIATNLEV